jgi:hypothetical protein
MSMTGPDPEHPTKVGVPIGDLHAGMYGAYEALWGRFAIVAGLDVVDERSSSNERRVAQRADGSAP